MTTSSAAVGLVIAGVGSRNGNQLPNSLQEEYQPSITAYEVIENIEPETHDTGLLDAQGRPIRRQHIKHPIGFKI